MYGESSAQQISVAASREREDDAQGRKGHLQTLRQSTDLGEGVRGQGECFTDTRNGGEVKDNRHDSECAPHAHQGETEGTKIISGRGSSSCRYDVQGQRVLETSLQSRSPHQSAGVDFTTGERGRDAVGNEKLTCLGEAMPHCSSGACVGLERFDDTASVDTFSGANPDTLRRRAARKKGRTISKNEAASCSSVGAEMLDVLSQISAKLGDVEKKLDVEQESIVNMGRAVEAAELKAKMQEQEATIDRLRRQRDSARLAALVQKGRADTIRRAYGIPSDGEEDESVLSSSCASSGDSQCEESVEEEEQEGDEEEEVDEGDEEYDNTDPKISPMAVYFESYPGLPFLTFEDASIVRRVSKFHARLMLTARMNSVCTQLE